MARLKERTEGMEGGDCGPSGGWTDVVETTEIKSKHLEM